MATAGLLERVLGKTPLGKPFLGRDRRRSSRHRTDLPIRYRIYDPTRPEKISSWISAQLHDLSEHGAGILSNTMERDGLHMVAPDPESSEVNMLELAIPYGSNPIKIMGKTIWYVRNGEGDPFAFRIGVEFRGMRLDQRRRLREFVGICASAEELP